MAAAAERSFAECVDAYEVARREDLIREANWHLRQFEQHRSVETETELLAALERLARSVRAARH